MVDSSDSACTSRVLSVGNVILNPPSRAMSVDMVALFLQEFGLSTVMADSVTESISSLKKRTIDVLRPFIGKNPEQIEAIIKEHLNPSSKSYFRSLADRMLKSSPDLYLQLVESGLSIRAIRVKPGSSPKESMSFPFFKFEDIVNQEWETSDLKKQLSSGFLFLVFETTDNDDFIFSNAAFWSIPDDDLKKISFVWEDTKVRVLEEKYDSFISKMANMIVHVRPHAQSSSDIQIYNGKECKKYSFWLNNDYVGEVLSNLPQVMVESDDDEEFPNLEAAIISNLGKKDGAMISFRLKRSLKPELLESESYEDTINSMIARGLIDRTPSGLRLKRHTLKHMLEDAPPVIIDYFSLDAESFVEKYSDDESVMLGIQSYFSVRPLEDDLGRDFSKYKLSSRLFQNLYEIDEITYRYLELMHPKGWMAPDELLNDPDKTDTFKGKLRASLYKVIDLGDVRVDIDNESIITYVASRFDKPKHINDLSRLCKDFIAKNGLKDAQLCRMNNADIKEYADKEGTHLLRIGSSNVRYYPHDAKEVVYFLKGLELERYKDMYISAQLILDESTDACNAMDIHDEQELYMLLSKYKTSQPMKDAGAILSSSPSICFGEANISDQIVKLLQTTGRVEKGEFCRLYSETYGMKEQSVRSYMAKYPQYSNGEYYDMNLPKFPDHVIQYLENMMVNHIISIDVAMDIFRKVESKFGLDSLDVDARKLSDPYFNAENLEKIGYKIAQGSLFRSQYGSFRECVESEYLSEDFISLNEDLKNNTPFMRIFNEHVDLKRYYLISEDKYISSSKLEGAGVTHDVIEDYIQNVINFVGEGDYFTLEYLRNNGFDHELEDQGFDDEFYTSILSSSRKLRGSDIGKHRVYTAEEKFIRNDAIVNITLKTLGNDDFDYVDLLSDRIFQLYGLNLISELKKPHEPIKYCKYTEKIYRDDDTYINALTSMK